MSAGKKLGAISFLNAEPLVRPLEDGTIKHGHSLVRAVPSELAAMLVRGELDCALAPVAVLLDRPDFIPIPDVAIASRGAVASVLVFHNTPFEDLDTIWLDPVSRTSNLLVRILVDRWSSARCRFVLPDGDEAPPVERLPARTGRLVIGDQALALGRRIPPPAPCTDLGELWREKTNHPFTFARWIATDGDTAAELKDMTREARDWSLLHLHELIGPLAGKYGFPPELVDRYLRTNITYMHGPREQAGEREFFLLAKKLLKSQETPADV